MDPRRPASIPPSTVLLDREANERAQSLLELSHQLNILDAQLRDESDRRARSTRDGERQQ
jgi:hypothetical protein